MYIYTGIYGDPGRTLAALQGVWMGTGGQNEYRLARMLCLSEEVVLEVVLETTIPAKSQIP